MQFVNFIKLRKEVDIKEHLDKLEVVFTAVPDEGGLAVAEGVATLTHRMSVDRVAFPKLRAALIAAIQERKDSVHLEEVGKKPRAEKKEVVVAPAEPIAAEPIAIDEPANTAIAKLEEMQLIADTPPPAPLPPARKSLPPAAAPTADIGVMLPVEPPPKPMPKKEQRTINRVTRANLAAAHRPPPVDIQPPPPSPPIDIPAPPAAAITPGPRVYGRTVPPVTATATAPTLRKYGTIAAPPTTAPVKLVFGVRK